ncbi:MAG TPA: hypothetical protein VMG41_11505 [Gemmatimonadales bacterium]|nr:hypothetical protein [Gemmatimonadales bacterium]
MRFALPSVLALTILSARAEAQLPLFAAASAGGALNINSGDPVAGNGSSLLLEVGVRFSAITVGAEAGRHDLGPERLWQYGAFVRIPAFRDAAIRPYAVLGLADYRLGPSGSGTWSIGGSVGPGAVIPVFGRHAAVVLEARIHSTFRGVGTISNPEFLTVAAGLDLAL